MNRWEAFSLDELEELKAAVEARFTVAKEFAHEEDMTLVTLALLLEELQEACQQAQYKFPRIVGDIRDEYLPF